MEIVLATHNLHKVREFREMFKGLKNIDLISLLNFPDYHLPEETGKTFFENAVLKAEHASKELNRWVLADDSGLIIPALQGRPGVFSQRYAGEEASDAENKKKLLNEMENMLEIERSAYFECCLALASPEGLKKTVTGKCEGYITTQEKGRNGFGYDSLFIKNDYKETFAELDEHTKNRISHRRKALDKLLTTLEIL
jgi:XTP/dITP diphosphohydrolase